MNVGCRSQGGMAARAATERSGRRGAGSPSGPRERSGSDDHGARRGRANEPAVGGGTDVARTSPAPVIRGRSSTDRRPGSAAFTAGIALTILHAPAIRAPRSWSWSSASSSSQRMLGDPSICTR